MRFAGVDVARMGNDYSVVTVVDLDDDRFTVQRIDFFSKIELMQLVGWVKLISDEEKPDKIMIDAIGVGAGVFDRLNEMGLPVIAVNVAEKPTKEPDKFMNKKSEMFWNLRKLFENGNIRIRKIKNYERLMGELSVMKFEFSSGKLKIKDPDKSPDFADSLALACFGPTVSAQKLGAAMVDIW
jgi:hypothetical protein